MPKKILLPHYTPIDKKYLNKKGNIDWAVICEGLIDDMNFFDDVYDTTSFDEMDGRLYSIDYPKYYYYNSEIINFAEDCIGRPVGLDEQAELIETWKEVYEYEDWEEKLEEEYWNRNDND